ncbi:MAG: branched-chain amino acid ABC transporter permease [Epulopiscium sp.]|nr:branched-chain amino acid ABC transporter permease [Candidatus Epulonipiscium sp.]
MMKRKTQYITNAIAIVLLYILFLLLIQTGLLSSYYTGLLILIGINIILATSLNLATGFLGQLALGHAGFMAIGAYSSAIFTTYFNISTTLGFILSLIIGGIIAGIFGILIGIPALRLKGDYLAIITLGFGEIIRIILNNLKITGGAKGLTGISRLTNFHLVFWVMVVVVTLLYTFVHSRHGRAVLSIRENEIAAEAVGIPTTYYKIFAFTLAAFFAGVGGGLYAHHIRTLMPSTFRFIYSVEILVIVVLGGMGSFTGSILAAIVLTILPEALRGLADYRMLIYSLSLILMMIFRPEGFLGTREFSLSRLFRKYKIHKKGEEES